MWCNWDLNATTTKTKNTLSDFAVQCGFRFLSIQVPEAGAAVAISIWHYSNTCFFKTVMWSLRKLLLFVFPSYLALMTDNTSIPLIKKLETVWKIHASVLTSWNLQNLKVSIFDIATLNIVVACKAKRFWYRIFQYLRPRITTS